MAPFQAERHGSAPAPEDEATPLRAHSAAFAVHEGRLSGEGLGGRGFGGAGNDDVYADAAGSGTFGGPSAKAVVVPEAVRRDVRAVVAMLRSAVGVER